jgi:hypothetical protein
VSLLQGGDVVVQLWDPVEPLPPGGPELVELGVALVLQHSPARFGDEELGVGWVRL